MFSTPVVLKFGSSVLRTPEDVPRVASEIYRYLRRGHRVIAVVSAYAGRTQALINDAAARGLDSHGPRYADHIASGEYESAAALITRCNDIGLNAALVTPAQCRLRAHGPISEAQPVSVDQCALLGVLDAHAVLVVPGFSAIDDHDRTVLLGRGGSDLTAVFLAHTVGADAAVLLKDVDGVYSQDPAVEPHAIRYDRLRYHTARAVSHGLIQPASIDFAERHDVAIDVRAIGAPYSTLIGARRDRPGSNRARGPLRVAVAGAGVVGGGVIERMLAEPERYALTAVRVTNRARHARTRYAAHVVTSDVALLDSQPDVIVEAINGTSAYGLHRAALARDIHVVSANKQALAHNIDALHDVANRSGSLVLYAAAVGGACPMLETVAALKRDGVTVARLCAVVNGTVNFVTSRMRRGDAYRDAIRQAQHAGFAEADPSADLRGDDAVAKARLLAHAAFPGHPVSVESVASFEGAQVANAWFAKGRTQQVALVEPRGNHTAIRVDMVPADRFGYLGQLTDEFCGAIITTDDGAHIRIGARGAGRVPTTEAILGDLGHIERRLIRQGAPERPSAMCSVANSA